MTPALATVALILLTTGGYAALCASRPFARCRRCHGIGFHLTADRKGHPKRGKTCRHCHTTGLRIRLGRHLYNTCQRNRNAAR